ncbi:MAG: molecular chaperone DnaJ [Thermotogota bacterium]
MPQKKDYYKTLEIDKSASQEEIRKAYRKMVKKWHPDRHQENKQAAEDKFKEVQEAYEVLSNPEKRKLYDRFGFIPEGGGYQQRGGQPGGGGVEDIFKDFFGGGSGNFGEAGGGFGDFFDMFFGSERSSSSRGSRRGKRPERGQDIHATISLDLHEVLYDVKKTIEYDRYEPCNACNGTGAENGASYSRCPRCNGQGQINEEQRTFFGTFVKTYTCPTCNGQGKIIDKKCSKCSGNGKIHKKEKLNITIPSGVEDGYVLRLREKGNAGKNGGPAGDLIIHVKVNPNKNFVRKGADLETQITVDYVEAALGTEVKIPTLEGEIVEKIPEGTNPGTVIRLKNLGMPNFSGKKRGDIYVKIKVKIDKPGLREKKHLKDLAKLKKINI